MKQILKLIFIAIVIYQFYGCENDSVSTQNENIYSLRGVIIPNDSVAGKRLVMYADYYTQDNPNSRVILTECTIGSYGEFQLNIPEVPDYILDSHGYSFGNSIISDSSVKLYRQDIYAVYNNNSYLGVVACIGKGFDSIGVHGNYTMSLFYCTKGVSIIGRDSSTTYVYHYNIIAKAGWNKLFYKTTMIDSLFYYINVYVDNDYAGNWYYKKF